MAKISSQDGCQAGNSACTENDDGVIYEDKDEVPRVCDGLWSSQWTLSYFSLSFIPFSSEHERGWRCSTV